LRDLNNGQISMLMQRQVKQPSYIGKSAG